jgi:hypothetical protein
MTWEEDFERVMGEPPPNWMVAQMESSDIVARPGETLEEFYTRKYGEASASERYKAEVLAAELRKTGLYSEEYIQTKVLGRVPKLDPTLGTVQTVAAAGPTLEFEALGEGPAVETTQYQAIFQEQEEAEGIGAAIGLLALIAPFLLGG